MAVGYSRIVEFSGTASTKTCVELPACPRGMLEKLVITQLTGTSAGGDFNVYDRKGACANANDLNVSLSGGVTSVANSSGQARITTDADHGLKVGDTIEVKGNTVSAYNVTHTVTVVVSATEVDTDDAPAPSTDTGYTLNVKKKESFDENEFEDFLSTTGRPGEPAPVLRNFPFWFL